MLSRFVVLSFFVLPLGILHLVKSSGVVRFPRVLLILLSAYYLVHLLSACWAINPAETLFESQKIFLGISIFLLGVPLFESNEKKERFYTALVPFSMLALIIAVCDIIYFSTDKEASVLFGHRNLMSSYFLALTALLFVGWHNLQGWWRRLALFLGIATVLFLIFLGTRSVLLALTVSSIIGLGIYFIKQPKIKVVYFNTGLGLCIIAGLLLLLFPALFHFAPNSITERFALWDNSKQLIQENPLLGVGSGNWQFNYAKFGVNDLLKTKFYNIQFRRPHNDYLSILTETGILGFGIFLTLIVLVWRKFSQQLKAEMTTEKLLLFCGILALMIVSFFSFPKERILHLMLFSILLAQFVPSLFAKKISINKIMLGSIVIGGMLFNLVVGSYRMSGEYFTKACVEAQAEEDGRAVIDLGHRAINTYYKTDPSGMPVYAYIGWGYDQKTLLDSLDYSSQMALKYAPYNYIILANYGYLLQRKYQFRKAREMYLESYRINPYYETTIVNISAMEYNLGNYASSLKWLQKVDNWETKYPTNYQRIKEKM